MNKIIQGNEEDFEITRPHNTGRLYNFLINYKFQEASKKLPFPIKSLSVLDVCCGSGMISEYYAKVGAKVTGVDLSEEAIERAKIRKERYGFEADFKVADVTNLPFSDNSFDIVSVHDGLHHIVEHKEAIKELFRVSKKGIIIIEPAKSLITKISVATGFSLQYEGEDFVYRFEEKQIRQWLIDLGCKKVFVKRYLMYYPHKPGRIFKIFDSAVLFCILKMFFYLVNSIFGKFGNKIQVVGLKE